MNLIAERLKNFRNEQGHNQEGVAKVAGMSQRAWAGWEESPPKALQSLVDLSTHYGVSADYLLNLTDDATPRRDKMTGPLMELIQIARRLSERNLRVLLVIARAFADDERGNGEMDKASSPKNDANDEATRAHHEAGINAAMNTMSRKYGQRITDDYIDTLIANVPELADLIGPVISPEHKRVNKSK